MSMRIIAGKFRGRRIATVPGVGTRPMIDRVRQAVFDVIGSALALPGSLPAVAVLDLFAGSGPLGIEALSRGANSCCFVEVNSSAIKALRGNLKALDLTEQAEVLHADATQALPPRPNQEVYELVFVDPPYALSRQNEPESPVGRLLCQLPQRAPMSPSALIVLRHEATIRYDNRTYGRLQACDVRRYGKMAITFMRPTEPGNG